MSHFYSTLEGNRGKVTRCGTKGSGITTHAASWSGAVRVELWHDDDSGRDWALVELVPWRGTGVKRELYRGPVDCLDGGLVEGIAARRRVDDRIFARQESLSPGTLAGDDTLPDRETHGTPLPLEVT